LFRRTYAFSSHKTRAGIPQMSQPKDQRRSRLRGPGLLGPDDIQKNLEKKGSSRGNMVSPARVAMQELTAGRSRSRAIGRRRPACLAGRLTVNGLEARQKKGARGGNMVSPALNDHEPPHRDDSRSAVSGPVVRHSTGPVWAHSGMRVAPWLGGTTCTPCNFSTTARPDSASAPTRSAARGIRPTPCASARRSGRRCAARAPCGRARNARAGRSLRRAFRAAR
jgi:hypothetical protein